MKIWTLSIILAVSCAVVLAVGARTDSGAISVTVDAAAPGRTIANLKKGYHIDTPDPWRLWSTSNYARYARDVGYDKALVRMHLFGALDAKQEMVRKIMEAHQPYGTPVFMVTLYGMPRSLAQLQPPDDANSNPGCDAISATSPPKDYALWKAMVKKFVSDLKGSNVTYWEVWNEPNNEGGVPGCFWSGTEAEYFNLYQTTVEAIQEAYGGVVPADVKIGAPALSTWDGKIFGGSGMPLYVTLPAFARQHKLPLDFFSWHYPDPRTLREAVTNIQAALNDNGFSTTELIVNEYGLGDPNRRITYATLTAATFAMMAKLGVSRQATYSFASGLELDTPSSLVPFKWAGLFGITQPGEELITTPKFNLFKAIANMGDTVVNADAPTAVTLSGQVVPNVSWSDFVLATTSSQVMSVMIANPTEAPRAFEVTINNVSPRLTARTRYIIDATRSNAYQVEDRITARMNRGRADAFTAGQGPFTDYLLARDYPAGTVEGALAMLQRAVADPNDAAVPAWFEALTLPQQQDVVAALTQPPNSYSSMLKAVADEINTYPEVQLYSDTQSISIPATGVYRERVRLEPYAVQVVVLSSSESACSPQKAAPYAAEMRTAAATSGVPLAGSNFLGCVAIARSERRAGT